MAKGFPKGSNPQNLPTVFRLHEVSDPRCKICQSPFRREIDACLATGWSQAMTRRHFNDFLGEEYFNKSNFHTHKTKHLTMKDNAVRKIMEEKARQLGMDIESIEALITTTEGVAASVVQIGLGNMMSGTQPVSVQDTLQAIVILEKMKIDRSDESLPELEREMKAFLKAVKKIVPEEMWKDIVVEFQANLGETPFQAAGTLEAGVEDGSS